MTRARALARLEKERVALGVCRHCGGPVPCRSEFGDRAVGKRHTGASLRKLRRVVGW